jgi:hypothetical protein
MGISVGVPIASNIVSSVKYSSPMLSAVRPPEDELPLYSDMLKIWEAHIEQIPDVWLVLYSFQKQSNQ